MQKSHSVDEYIDTAVKSRQGLRRLRRVLLESGLEETVKWGAPCYTLGGKDVVGLGAYKSFFGLCFFRDR